MKEKFFHLLIFKAGNIYFFCCGLLSLFFSHSISTRKRTLPFSIFFSFILTHFKKKNILTLPYEIIFKFSSTQFSRKRKKVLLCFGSMKSLKRIFLVTLTSWTWILFYFCTKYFKNISVKFILRKKLILTWLLFIYFILNPSNLFIPISDNLTLVFSK